MTPFERPLNYQARLSLSEKYGWCHICTDKWHKLALVVGSSNSSPAAKRIALCLLFAVYVIGPQLEVTKSDPWAYDRWIFLRFLNNKIVKTLFSPLPATVLTNIYIGARHLSAQKPSLSDSPSTIQERINAALLISLFAVRFLLRIRYPVDKLSIWRIQMTDNEVKSRNLAVIGSSRLRPDGYGYLLELIKIIINEDVATCTPSENLDVPQTILLRWGNAVPWSWSTWDDLRVANTEYIHVMVSGRFKLSYVIKVI